MQAPDVCIVPDIDDDMNIFLRYDLDETAQKFCCAGASGENSVVGCCHANILSGAQRRGPEIQNNGGHEMLNLADLAISDLPVEKAEHGAGDDFCV